MFAKKIDNNKFIIPVSRLEKVNKVLAKQEKRRKKLIESGHIEDGSIGELELQVLPITNDLINKNLKSLKPEELEELNKDRLKLAYVEIKGEPPRLDGWSILGVITPLEGLDEDYTLHSYTNIDLPRKYREIENPKLCEHCHTNRKRNKTFIIQNVDTRETVQVGSSCMTDYISKYNLDSLLKYTQISKDLEDIVKEKSDNDYSISLISKNEFLAALMLAQEKIGYLDSYEFYKSAILNSDQFDKAMEFYDPETCMNKYGFEIDDDQRDLADDLIDWYEDLDVSDYRDVIFNLKSLIASDNHFLTPYECRSIVFAVEFKELVDTNSPNLGQFKGAGFSFYKKETYNINLADYLSALKTVRGVHPYAKKSCDHSYVWEDNGTFSTHLLALGLSNPETAILEVRKVDERYLPEFLREIEKLKPDFEKNTGFGDEMVQWCRDYKEKFKDVEAFKTIANSDEFLTLGKTISLAYSYDSYSKALTKLDLIKKLKEKEKVGVNNFYLATGDRVESMNVKLSGYQTGNSYEYGTYHILSFEDEFGHTFSAFGLKHFKDAGVEIFDENSNPIVEKFIGKYIPIAGTVKGYRNNKIKNTDQVVKTTNLNRVKVLADGFSDSPDESIQLKLKGKYTIKQLKVESVESLPNDKFRYSFSDASGEKFSALSGADLGLDEGACIESPVMIAQARRNYDDGGFDDRDLVGFEVDKISKIDSLDPDFEETQLTPAKQSKYKRR